MRSSILWFVLVASLAGSPAALADGKAFSVRDRSGLAPATQHEQIAAIHHRDGRQHMLIAINVDLEDDEGGLWIFPLPGSPEQTTVEFTDHFPRFRGVDPRALARGRVPTVRAAMLATQIYPMLFCGLFLFGGVEQGGREHTFAEKWGLRAGVVTVDSLDDLVAYVQTDHPGAGRDNLVAFEPYCSADYVFVVVRLKSLADLMAEFPEVEELQRRTIRGRWPCLYVEFDAERAFYPMRPTASYGDIEMGLRLYVLGAVSPKTAPAFQEVLQARYFEQPGFSDALPTAFLAGLPKGDIPYTRITTFSAAENFVDDLYFVPGPPPGLAYSRVFNWLTQPALVVPTWLLFTALVSYPCGGLSGLIVFRRWQRPALLGLFNCLTILGLIVAVHRTEYAALSSRPRQPIDSFPKRVYLYVFSLLFTGVTLAVTWLAQWPLEVAA